MVAISSDASRSYLYPDHWLMLRLDSIAVAAKEVLTFGGTGISNENKEVCGMTKLAMFEESVLDGVLGGTWWCSTAKRVNAGGCFTSGVRSIASRTANTVNSGGIRFRYV